MSEFVCESSQKNVFFQLAHIVDIVKASVDVNTDLVGFARIKFALGIGKFAICIRLGLVQHDVDTGNLGNGAQCLVCLATGIAHSLSKISDGHTLTTDHAALLPSGLAIGSGLVLGILCNRLGIGSSLASLISQLLLRIRQIACHLALLRIGKRHTASAHVISCLVCLVVF